MFISGNANTENVFYCLSTCCFQTVDSVFYLFLAGTYLMNGILESLDPLSSFDLSCNIECNFMWDGFGRWLGRNWKPFLRRKLNYSCMVCLKGLSFFIILEKPLRINHRNKYIFMCYYYYYYYRNTLAPVDVVPT